MESWLPSTHSTVNWPRSAELGSAVQTTWQMDLWRPRSTVIKSPTFTSRDAEQPRAAGMNVIGASQFEVAARAVPHVGEANRQRQMDQLFDRRGFLRLEHSVSWQSILLRWMTSSFTVVPRERGMSST